MAYIPTINDLRNITPILTHKLKFDYSNFGLSFLKRRLCHIFEELNIKKLQQFTNGLEDCSLLEDIKYYFPVPTTELFRDPSFWRRLRNKTANNPEQSNLTFWFPELSSGEELFSLLIILHTLNCRDNCKIICNVQSSRKKEEILKGYLSPKNIELNKQNIKRVDPNIDVTKFFNTENNNHIFNTDLLSSVEIIPYNFLVKGPDKDSVYITIFRNNLINYNRKLQNLAENELAQYIRKDGFLAIGINERISIENNSLYFLYDKNESIYQIIK